MVFEKMNYQCNWNIMSLGFLDATNYVYYAESDIVSAVRLFKMHEYTKRS